MEVDRSDPRGNFRADSPVRVLKKKNGFSRGYWVRVVVSSPGFGFGFGLGVWVWGFIFVVILVVFVFIIVGRYVVVVLPRAS